jgi:5'-nucleotidase
VNFLTASVRPSLKQNRKRSFRRDLTQGFILLISSVLLVHCTSAPKVQTADDFLGGPRTPDMETIVILGTNDIHGALAPMVTKTREEAGIEPIEVERGGAALLAAHIKTLREEFGDRLLLLDAGDEFQGSIESNREEGAPMVRLFNHLGFHAAAVGNHEFDFGPIGPEGSTGDKLGALKQRLKEAKYPYLSANMIEKATGKTPTWDNLFTRTMVQAGRVRVGVLGLSTLSTPVTTRPDNITSLAFTDLKAATEREAKALRTAGADLVVVTAHVGLKCYPGKTPHHSSFRKETDPQGPCEEEEEATQLLHALKPGTIDAFVSGHTHQVVHHWVNGVPVIQAGTRNLYFNLIYLTVDTKTKKLMRERTLIEGPVPICTQVFENQRDCNGDRPAPKNGRGDLVTPVFHGRKIKPDSETQNLLEPIFEATEVEKKRIVGKAAREIIHVRETESPLGALVADAIRAEAKTDIALMNPGGVRANWDAGDITYEELFRVLPFDNFIAKLEVTGKELKQILRSAFSGPRGFFPVSGLRLKIIELSAPAPSDDLDQNRKIEPWEINRLVDVRLENGERIQDHQRYTLAMNDFMASGGDDLGWAMKQIPESRVKKIAGPLLRDAVESYLKTRDAWNTEDSPILDRANPRVMTVKAPEKTGKKRRRSARRRK